MPTLRIEVTSPADRLLFEGLPHLQPVLESLGSGAMLIGGLAATAWIGASDVDLPMRATRDVDLGIDRRGLRLTASRSKVVPLLRKAGFESMGGNASFRFVKEMPAGEFIVDLLVAPGSSRSDPPVLEEGLTSLPAPGLAYAILRRPQMLALTIAHEGKERQFDLPIVSLDSAFVMKAVLTASRRLRPDRRITDTADAVMLAAACAKDKEAITALGQHHRRKDVREATRWVTSSFETTTTAAARRVERHVQAELNQPGRAAWAVEVSRQFTKSIS